MTSFDQRLKILALAPFASDADRIPSVRPWVVERTTLDEVMGTMNIRFTLFVEKRLCPRGSLTFQLDRLKSLHPDGIVKSHPFFQQLTHAKAFVQNARQKGEPAGHIRQGLNQWPELPPLDIQDRPLPETSEPTGSIDNILNMVALDSTAQTSTGSGRGETDQIDAIVSSLLAALFADARFQTMESAWRGLRLLLQQGVENSDTVVSIAALDAESMAERLEALTPHLVNDPPSVVLLDLPFDNTPLGVERLGIAAQWAATLMVPVIAWVPANFFQLSQWSELGTLPYLPHHLQTQAYVKFHNLKQSPNGHWLCLTCNRFLVRHPYGTENRPRHASFSESSHNWIAPVWGLGTLIAQSTSRHRWPTRFCDIRHFRLQDLAFHSDGDLPPLVSETLFDLNRLEQLVQAGFTPLATEPKRDSAFFPKAVTVNGNSLAFQLLLAQVTQFVLWCKDHLSAESNPDHLKQQLSSALTIFSQQSDPSAFSSMEIETQPMDPEGRIPVVIRLTPAVAILPGTQPIELQINW